MPGQTPDQIAAQWASRLGQSGQRITDGVQAVQVAPGQAAARQKAVYVQNVNASADKWASRVSSVPLSDWQNAMTTKGVQRIGQGATAAQPKFAAFMGQLLPHIATVRSSLPPRGGLDQNIARMTQFVQGMAKFQRR
jgi:hypothetical protein